MVNRKFETSNNTSLYYNRYPALLMMFNLKNITLHDKYEIIFISTRVDIIDHKI